ncbi:MULTISPECIES: ABC transporter substrate-binding protein [Pasteurellaceae]|uniref:ABC transporter substrate-binding protein n=1 Tax=Pasteurella atlantica TaxID=2827233 RepID=A0AAW8CMU0_9PAST|nr:ABC transporter substrate-binding protein [Pasteurella atlantica]MBR0573495.1 ABC transporter substrate-binding protein [Pasteurella atlantica]MDP8039496.1 ABC transporter substrate-binding protein [Pasteurella atlantica]MDP8041587.1 ABC transporter substrate-binding protein [Pasteurella atlantica]MDP8043724.1 ABC transporter substrate-binding protein [Pasteurella atlantica]MDP8045779.1 ABC transporter substrate-binding protein [Pasteurella atlantica]
MKKSKFRLLKTVSAVALGLAICNTVAAKGHLVIYCSATNAMCENAAKTFGKKYGVKTQFIRNGSGSTFAKVKAEASNPQADVWYGGTFDPQSQAGEVGLLTPYKSKNLDQIVERFRDPGKKKGNYTSAIYMGILGFGVNTERLEKLGIKQVPQCWNDLLKPEFKDEIQVADPQSSGTAYTAIATFVQLWGEDKAFDYFKKLDPNISQYTKSGVTPSRNAARGETAVGIGFLHDYMLEKSKGAKLKLVVPCEGTGYELGGISILKGARNLDNAKLFVDWALSKEGQESAWQKGQSLQILTNTTAKQHPAAPNPDELKLINYDFEKYGSKDERKRLIDRWVDEVKMK